MNESLTSRSHDEDILRMVQMRRSGMSCGQVAKKFGRSAIAITNVTNKVFRADVEHCGERVSSHYWAPNDKRNVTKRIKD